MELKQAKPIHLKCPKCGYDFSYNTNHIEEEIDTLKCDITSIRSQMAQHKANNPKGYRDAWYRKANSALQYKQAQITKLKKARKATAVEIKLQTFELFKKIVKDRYGQDEYLKMIKEAEEELVYYTWDMATQHFTRFENA